MIVLTIIIFLYSISYLIVYVLAHQDANMIKPLTAMTAGMLALLFITGLMALFRGFWYVSIIVLIVIIGMVRFFFYLNKY